MENNSILSPVMIWSGFRLKYPLQPMKTSEEVFDNVIYSEVYFSGRETKDGRVRIFGMLAKSRALKKGTRNAGILILPDASMTVDLTNLVKGYVQQGYVVFLVDYKGKVNPHDNCTQYPKCISYANYASSGRTMDYCDHSAKDTCWYEWVSVAKYALGFLRSQPDMASVGVIGIGTGADIGWQLCSTEAGEVECFIPLFCAGGRAYKGYYKNDPEDMPMNDERVKYLAGVDSSAYSQYMNVPTFFLTATNSTVGDIERSLDSLSRVPEKTPVYQNFTPRARDVLDIDCKRDIDLFLAKYLLGFNVEIPKEPRIVVKLEDKRLLFSVEEDDYETNEVKKVTAYVAEGSIDPAFRFWSELKPAVKVDGKQAFKYVISSSCPFVSVFAVVNYKNGFTLSTNLVTKSLTPIDYPKENILFSGKNGIESVCPYELKEKAEAGLFYTNEIPISLYEGDGKIKGVTSDGAMIFYRFNPTVFKLHENSLLKMDVIGIDHCVLKITVVTEKLGATTDHSISVTVRRGGIWKDVLLKLSEFKSEQNRSIEDYGSIVALKLYSDVKFAVNNILVI